jgi:hypothetical protein
MGSLWPNAMLRKVLDDLAFVPFDNIRDHRPSTVTKASRKQRSETSSRRGEARGADSNVLSFNVETLAELGLGSLGGACVREGCCHHMHLARIFHADRLGLFAPIAPHKRRMRITGA